MYFTISTRMYSLIWILMVYGSFVQLAESIGDYKVAVFSEGETAHIECQFLNANWKKNQFGEFKLEKDEFVYEDDYRADPRFSRNGTTLKIANITKTDAAMYYCEEGNGHSSTDKKQYIALLVVDSLSKFVQQYADCPTLNCDHCKNYLIERDSNTTSQNQNNSKSPDQCNTTLNNDGNVSEAKDVDKCACLADHAAWIIGLFVALVTAIAILLCLCFMFRRFAKPKRGLDEQDRCCVTSGTSFKLDNIIPSDEESELMSTTSEFDRTDIRIEIIKEIATEGMIKGVAVVDNNVYIVRNEQSTVEIYDFDTECLSSKIDVKSLESPVDLAYNIENNRLYVSDQNTYNVHVIFLTNNTTTCIWKHFQDKPEGLSIIRESSNILVAFPFENKIIQYTADTKFVREIPLQVAVIRHALMLPNTTFVVCCEHDSETSNTSNLSIVTEDGKILSESIGRSLTKEANYFTRSTRTQSGFLIVVNHFDMLVFDNKLKQIKELTLENHRTLYPSRLFLDDSKRRLYLTENIPDGKIIICDLIENETNNKE